MEMLEKEMGAKGEVVVPKEWREELKLRAGAKIILEKEQFGLVIRPKIKNPVDALARLDVKLGKKRSEEIIKEFRRKIDEEYEI